MAGVVLGKLVSYLNAQLQVDSFEEAAVNGLQVAGKKLIRKIAFAVDGVLETFQQAAAAEADMLIVHHGIYWGRQYPLRGADYQRIKVLVDHEIALYAAHLPLDAHPQWGHAANLLRGLDVHEASLEPFGHYKGQTIGFQGRVGDTTREELSRKLETLLGGPVKVLGFGPDKVRSVACVTGAGADFSLVREAKIRNIHFYVSGEASHPIYHFAKENAVNLALGGHYHTEVFGLKALQTHLQERFQVETCFIDCPSGL